MPEVTVHAGEAGRLRIGNVLRDAGLVGSTSEGMRMVKQGAVRIDGERVGDPTLEIPAGETHVIQVGKRRFARVTVSS